MALSIYAADGFSSDQFTNLEPVSSSPPSQAVAVFQRILDREANLQAENTQLKHLVFKAHDYLIEKSLKDLFRLAYLEPGLKESMDIILKDPAIPDISKPHLIVKMIRDVLDNENKELVIEDRELEGFTVIDLNKPKTELRKAFDDYRKVLSILAENLFPELSPKQVEEALEDFADKVAKDPKRIQEIKGNNAVAWTVLGGVVTVAGFTIWGLNMVFHSALKTVETTCKVVETTALIIVAIPTAISAVYSMVATSKKN